MAIGYRAILNKPITETINAGQTIYILIPQGIANVSAGLEIIDSGAKAKIQTSLCSPDIMDGEDVADFQFSNLKNSGGTEVSEYTTDTDNIIFTAPNVVKIENSAAHSGDVGATESLPEITSMVLTGATKAEYEGKYFIVYDGETPYLVWFDITGEDTKPEVEGFTSCADYSIDISAATDSIDAIGTALETAFDTAAAGVFTSVYTADSDTFAITTVSDGNSTDALAGNLSATSAVVSSFTVTQQGQTIESNPKIRISLRGN